MCVCVQVTAEDVSSLSSSKEEDTIKKTVLSKYANKCILY